MEISQVALMEVEKLAVVLHGERSFMESRIKVTFGMIIYNSDSVLKECLESIYPFAHKICISEGCVDHFVKRGITGSTDRTNEILANFPDPENKITVEHGVYKNKTDQCKAWFKDVPEDTDYVWCIDSDEIFKPEDISKVISVLALRKPRSVGFQSNTFFGGFTHILGGFERDHSFRRVLKYVKGCEYIEHRPPTLGFSHQKITGADISGKELYDMCGVEMYHYSYVFEDKVEQKIQYYEDAVIRKGHCIPNYFNDVWLRWRDSPSEREEIENRWNGVHEFMPSIRGECRTKIFTGKPPEVMKEVINA